MIALRGDETARVVAAALAEDLGSLGDITTTLVIDPGRLANASIVARSELVLAGIDVAREVFRQLDGRLDFEVLDADGKLVAPFRVVARIEGRAHPILAGERTALNFLMRMSGIATAARAATREIAHTRARILDTRKTAPGLRLLDKYAVAVGGATNHRLGLFDAILIKDTHLAAAGGIAAAVAAARDRGHPPEQITVEVGSLEQLAQAIEAGAGRVLLDNMEPQRMREAVQLARGRVLLEASGGLRPGRLRSAAETGVDFLSLGWLTHSAPAADFALELEPRP